MTTQRSPESSATGDADQPPGGSLRSVRAGSTQPADEIKTLVAKAIKTMAEPLSTASRTSIEAAANEVAPDDYEMFKAIVAEMENRSLHHLDEPLTRANAPAHNDLDPDRVLGDVLPQHDLDVARLPDRHDDDPRLLPPPTDPMRVAGRFIEDRYRADDHVLLCHSRNTFYSWTGTHWPEAEDRTLRAQLYEYLQDALYAKKVKGDWEAAPWEPNRYKIADVLDALKAVGHLPASVNPPAWIGGDDHVPPHNLIALDNGLLHIPTRELIPHTPEFWSHNALPYGYDPSAGIPPRWETFLAELWGDDQESIDTLQEIFGYALTQDTTQQKIALLVGPKRSGKGTIARVLTGLLGAHNVAGPTLSGMAGEFGLAPLIDKPLAIISDARLSTRTDTAAVVERLLAISGEDSLDINRKYKEHWSGRLATRFLIISNELPRLSDSSGALASRFIMLTLNTSFYGKEDPTLTDILLADAGGILNWALDGLDRLRDRGHFSQPSSSEEAIRQLEDLASPISAFIRDWCEVGPEQQVATDILYKAWRSWAENQGMNHVSTQATFGRDLRSAAPNVKKIRTRDGEDRSHLYLGIALKQQGSGHRDHL